MKEQQKSSAQIALERIMSAPKDPRYIEVPDLPIPTAYWGFNQALRGRV